jgi:hypothetical protein
MQIGKNGEEKKLPSVGQNHFSQLLVDKVKDFI